MGALLVVWLSRFFIFFCGKINLCWRATVKRGMWSFVIIGLQVFFETCLELFHILIAFEVYILIFDSAPKPLDKNIVQGPTSPVHT